MLMTLPVRREPSVPRRWDPVRELDELHERMKVETTGTELRITGELKERERTGWLRSRTRRVGHFEYRTTLPQEIDVDGISAELADGVLTVRVPKSEEVKPRRIQVTGN